MELVDRVVALFGLSPEDPTVSSLLDDYKISERPVFDETPIHWISAKDKGFVLMFEEKLGYKDIYGPCAGSGGMVLGGIRVYGSQNDDDFAPFKQKLPCGLDFSQSRADKVGNKWTMTAGDEASITVGKSSLVMKADGTITLSGSKINIDASGPIQINGKDVNVN